MFEKMLENKENLYSIYLDCEDTNVFYVGKLIGIDEDYILLQSVNPFGEDDGIICFKKCNVYRIDYNGIYENNISKLTQFTSYDIELKDNIIINLLEFAKHHNYIIEFELYDNEENNTKGYVKDITDNQVTIRLIDESGRNDGETIILIESISLLGCNSKSCRKVEILSKDYE